jgi:hypothetical protein
MLAIEAYKRFLLKINKNDTNSDIDISKGEFVLLYNEQKDRWLDDKIGNSEASDRVLHLDEVQVKHAPLTKLEDKEHYSIFAQPQGFFSYITSYAVCSNKDCKGIILRCFEMKPRNENMLLENTNTEPSLEFEETVVDLSDGKIYVYRKDFEVDELKLNYYREAGKIDIAGYRHVDGTLSTNIDPDLSDIAVDEILNRCALEVIRRYENPDGYQLAAQRTQD